MTDHPHIIFIYSDQHRADCLGCHGHPLLETPHLDRLAREGCDFTQAYTPCPICVPARVSLLSGRYTCQHRTVANFDAECFQRPDPSGATHPRVMSQAGYHTRHIGRWHVDPQYQGTDFGFHDFQQDWRYAKYREARGLPPRQAQPGERFGGIDQIAFEDSSLAWHAREVIRAIDWQVANEDDPCMIHWHMVEPHPPYWPVAAFAERYDPAALSPWPGFADDLADKPWIQRQMPSTWGIADLTWDDWAPVVARYLATISQLDAAIGLVLDALDERGLTDQTLVVYTSDHGDMCGSHHMFDKHYVMYDDVCRVPLVMRWPDGGVDGGRVCDDFVCNAVDWAPTACAAAGVPAPPSFAGVDLLPAARGSGGTGRDDIYSAYHGNQFGGYTQRMLRDRRWKYVWNATNVDELYDLASDPGECRNLIDDPAAQVELPRLRGRLAAWMDELGDGMLNQFTRRQLTEGDIIGGPG